MYLSIAGHRPGSLPPQAKKEVRLETDLEELLGGEDDGGEEEDEEMDADVGEEVQGQGVGEAGTHPLGSATGFSPHQAFPTRSTRPSPTHIKCSRERPSQSAPLGSPQPKKN